MIYFTFEDRSTTFLTVVIVSFSYSFSLSNTC